MPDEFSIDPLPLLKFIGEGLADLIGQDPISRDLRERVGKRQRTSLYLAQRVLIPSMDSEVPMSEIYQDLRFTDLEESEQSAGRIGSLVDQDTDSAILIAPPGRGKTVSLRHLFMQTAERRSSVPLLFTLNDEGAIDELATLIDGLSSGRRVGPAFKSVPVRLFLDGYDEIPRQDRASLSKLLVDFESMKAGSFVLTCRMYYDIISLPIRRRYLMPFTEEDALAFLTSFLRHQRSKHSALAVVSELRERGFSDFMENPLFLALVSILQRKRNVVVPRNALRLLEEVTLFLTYRRETEHDVLRDCIDGLYPDDLLACLHKVAFAFDDIQEHSYRAERTIREYLDRRQVVGVNPRDVLMELARWYGLVVPAHHDWRFVHRSIQDWLAAKYMLAHQLLDLSSVRRNWRRASYAACYLDDASPYIRQSLRGPGGQGGDLEMFVECCANDANFNTMMVARDLLLFYAAGHDGFATVSTGASDKTVNIALEQDYVHLIKTEMLHAMTEAAGRESRQHRGSMILLGLAISELDRRGVARRNVTEWAAWTRGITWSVTRGGGVGLVVATS